MNESINSILVACAQNEFEVVELVFANSTLSTLDFSWTLPTNPDYDSLQVRYTTVDDSTSFGPFTLPKEQTLYSVSGLLPGTTVRISVSTLKGTETLAVSTYSAVNGEKNFFVLEILVFCS